METGCVIGPSRFLFAVSIPTPIFPPICRTITIKAQREYGCNYGGVGADLKHSYRDLFDDSKQKCPLSTGCMCGRARVQTVNHSCPAQKQTMDAAIEFLDLELKGYFIKDHVSWTWLPRAPFNCTNLTLIPLKFFTQPGAAPVKVQQAGVPRASDEIITDSVQRLDCVFILFQLFIRASKKSSQIFLNEPLGTVWLPQTHKKSPLIHLTKLEQVHGPKLEFCWPSGKHQRPQKHGSTQFFPLLIVLIYLIWHVL